MKIEHLILGLLMFYSIGYTSEMISYREINQTIKKDIDDRELIINLDEIIKKSKKNNMKGTLREKAIPIVIGDNKTITFIGEVVKKIKKIKIGDNDEVALRNQFEYTIKTVELEDGDEIIIEYKDNKKIKMKVRRY
jgi:hypothetical protein